jgi:HK97 gp10 family phage protein
MPGVEVEVIGGDALLAKMTRVEQSLEKALLQALDTAGSLVVTEAKANHPYTDRTQNLTNSIEAIPAKREGTVITAGARAGMRYGRRVELGFVGVDSLGRRYHQKPRAFLGPALRRNRKAITLVVKKAVQEAVRNA